MEEQRMWVAEDVAAFLQVCVETVYRWCGSRALPHFRVANMLRFDPTAVKAWLASQAVAPIDAATARALAEVRRR